MKKLIAAISMILLAAMCTGVARCADVKVASVFSSHMVLQQGMQCPVWGWADAGEKITVQFDTQSLSANADSSGNWRVNLEPLKSRRQAAHADD